MNCLVLPLILFFIPFFFVRNKQQNATKINKGFMQTSLNALNEQITKAVRDGGDSIIDNFYAWYD